MSTPILPKYSSSENNKFHPVFRYAIEKAIDRKKLSNQYEIRSQYPTPTGPVDFVVFNKVTKKVVFPIEIKRIQEAVRGEGRRQARDYWTNLGTQCETKYYCVSNLELTELFRNDPLRPRTLSQRIKLTNQFAGLLEPDPKTADFYKNLILCLEEILDIVCGIKDPNYETGLTQFQDHLKSYVEQPDNWHKIFIPLCFEYIRGVALKIPNLQKTQKWKNVESYKKIPSVIANLGREIDFDLIFADPLPEIRNDIAFIDSILKEAFESGKTLGHGDDIAEIVNDILAPIAPGIIETDNELALLLGVMARVTIGRPLKPDEIVIDPGSGSGRLLSVLPLISFPEIAPRQIWANEIERRFAESLSLRLGLAFSSVIAPLNTPKITILPIENIDPIEFSNIKVVIMNPPFLSGVQSASTKESFVRKIKKVSNEAPMLNHGQIGLEALFLELVWHYVSDNTVIATVFPAQHLFRLSKEVVKLREFLVNKFKLVSIVVYPQIGLFKDVVKQTVLLIGEKNVEQSFINVVEIQKEIGNIDLAELLAKFHNGGEEPTYAVNIQRIDRDIFFKTASSGWRVITEAGRASMRFIEKYMTDYSLIKNLDISCFRRGTVGNSGNTALTVFEKDTPKYPSVVNKIPLAWKCFVLNTTENMPKLLNISTSPQYSFCPPSEAYQDDTIENKLLYEIINVYINAHIHTSGSQAKKVKTPREIINNLKSDQKSFGPGWIIIQRASRTSGMVGFVEDKGILLSTNVPMIKLNSDLETKLMASWLFSVFGQMQMELYGTPQEGMRKMEQGSIGRISYPDFSSISELLADELIRAFLEETPLKFKNIKIRHIDRLWAEYVDPINSKECLSAIFELFSGLVLERISFGER